MGLTPGSDLAGRFSGWSGGPADGVWRAPGRVNLIGEHLDYNGGYVLPFALDRSVWLAARRRTEPRLRCRSARFGDDVEVPLDSLDRADGWAAYPAGVLWTLRDRLVEPVGLDLLVDSSVPAGAGLSSSAALTCAVALAVADLAGLDTSDPHDRLDLARAAQRAETAVAGAPVGIMDQAASMLSREGHALYLDCTTLAFEHLPLNLAAAGLILLAVDTGITHDHTTNLYSLRREECQEAARALGVTRLVDADPGRLDSLEPVLARRARHAVSEQRRTRDVAAALRLGRLDGLGAALTASHRSLQYDFDCSVPVMDAVVDAVLQAGAEGARMTGGGWGGTAIALVAAERIEAVTESVRAVLGASAPVSEVRPGPGAERVA
jgi:galactokinase